MSALSAFADLMDEPQDDLPWHIDPKDKDPRSEIKRQMAVLRDGKRICPGVDFIAIPNAGKATDWERIQRWKEGARAGALDLVATWQGGVAFLEMKNGKDMPTPAQRDRLNFYHRIGHHCGVFRQEASVFAFLRHCGAPFIVREGL